MPALTLANWIAIGSVAAGMIGATAGTLNYLAGRRERQRVAQKSGARVQGTINAKYYRDGWRSVQLHMVPVEEGQPNFDYKSWRIERAELLRPRNAVLARAADDDYATGVFYPENPVRLLLGKLEGRPQRFALEFFIKFPEGDTAGKAKFKVTFSQTKTGKLHTATVLASLPSRARFESAPS